MLITQSGQYALRKINIQFLWIDQPNFDLKYYLFAATDADDEIVLGRYEYIAEAKNKLSEVSQWMINTENRLFQV